MLFFLITIVLCGNTNDHTDPSLEDEIETIPSEGTDELNKFIVHTFLSCVNAIALTTSCITFIAVRSIHLYKNYETKSEAMNIH